MLKWFESYLSHRTQYVVFDGENLTPIVLNVVYPKDPLLFILSVNDICNVSSLLFKILFADDTCVLLSDKNLNTLVALRNTKLISLNNWLKPNKLSLNTKKIIFF